MWLYSQVLGLEWSQFLLLLTYLLLTMNVSCNYAIVIKTSEQLVENYNELIAENLVFLSNDAKNEIDEDSTIKRIKHHIERNNNNIQYPDTLPIISTSIHPNEDSVETMSDSSFQMYKDYDDKVDSDLNGDTFKLKFEPLELNQDEIDFIRRDDEDDGNEDDDDDDDFYDFVEEEQGFFYTSISF